MAFVAVPNVCECEWRCTRNAQNIENRIMVDFLEPPTPVTMEELSVVLWDWWQNTHSQHLHTGVALREVVITDLSEQNGNQITYAPSTTVAGQIGTPALPNESAFCVSLRSAFRGRSARGRWYTLSVTQSQMVNDNNLTTAAVGDFVQDLNTLRTSIVGEGRAFVIVSYRSNHIPRPGGPVKFVVQTATAVDALIDSMKRRKPGVGS